MHYGMAPMRTINLVIAQFLCSMVCFSQTQVLADYNFDKGGYYMLGVFNESDRNGLRDSLGEFYTDSIPILNQFKHEWTFDTPGQKWACGYHYTIYVCKDGLPVEYFNINLNCNEIVSDDGYFYFDTQKLRMFMGKVKKPLVKSEKFDSIPQARARRAEILSQPKLITTFTPDWTTYEGEFNFTYTCPASVKDCFDEEDTLLKQLSGEIQNAYPGEVFELEGAGGSRTELFVNVLCNKSLADKFRLYPLSWKEWTPYSLYLRSYWVPE